MIRKKERRRCSLLIFAIAFACMMACFNFYVVQKSYTFSDIIDLSDLYSNETDEDVDEEKSSDTSEIDVLGSVIAADEEKIKHADRLLSIQEHRRNRVKHFNSWFEGNSTDKLLPNIDENGTILDFAIIGYPKCGTTTMEANLGKLAPMPVADICTPIHQTVYYAHQNWPKEFGEEKILRGTKCPAFIQDEWLKEWSTYLPRTKLIIGIRHPILWFQR